MILRFWTGKGFVSTDTPPVIECPNEFGGIGNIHIKSCGCGFWTGETWLWGDEFSFGFSCVKKIEIRSNLWETDEKWRVIWKYNRRPFTYQYWFDLAEMVRQYRTLGEESK